MWRTSFVPEDFRALVISMPLDRFFSSFFQSRGFWKIFVQPSLHSPIQPMHQVCGMSQMQQGTFEHDA